MVDEPSPRRTGHDDPGTLQILTTTWVDLSGEIDLITHEQLRHCLRAVGRLRHPTVHVFMSRVGFCDVRGLCEIAAVASQVHQRGGRLTLHGASATVQKVARIMQAHDLIQFT